MIVRGLHFSFDAGGDAALATLFYPVTTVGWMKLA